ncbi:glycosyltransferase family 1 protein [Bacillus sp. OK048]|uniref:glycosyltransferase family 1 protein n=1 Tax=Bacillus sp. OK048 TaxID=1882761 RepID=UPI00088554B6|nr:glycosyltransferase family 1 protein [Bacillus sp. OK048]SDN56875.1 Glycosyltransferase involved in cell wall bisynthesis [Bacillus sp. OK048]
MVNRVLHIFAVMNPGGAETMIMNIYRKLDRSKVQFDFLVHGAEKGYYEQEIIDLGGRIYRVSYSGAKHLLRFRQELYAILKQNSFRAVHSHVHHFSGAILPVAKKAGVPVRIAHSHTISDGKKLTFHRQMYEGYMKYKILQSATHLMACTEAAAKALYSYKSSHSIVIRNSIDLSTYARLDNGNKRKSRERIGVPIEKTIIGHVGRFDPVKNHEYLLHTFYHYHKKNPNSFLVLVGEGSEENKINSLAKKLGIDSSVKMLGNRSDIPEVMNSFDYFLFPSLFEGLGNVLIEAQAAGIPCLVSSSIPKEADLGLGLLTFKVLTDGAESWAESINLLEPDRSASDWTTRKRQLKVNGYDSEDQAKIIEDIYIGG